MSPMNASSPSMSIGPVLYPMESASNRPGLAERVLESLDAHSQPARRRLQPVVRRRRHLTVHINTCILIWCEKRTQKTARADIDLTRTRSKQLMRQRATRKD